MRPTLDELKMAIGLVIVIGLFTFGVIVAMAKVSQETSFGLQEIIGCLGVLAGAFAGWAFGRASGPGDGK